MCGIETNAAYNGVMCGGLCPELNDYRQEGTCLSKVTQGASVGGTHQ
jgi:hypothetical protein